MVETFALTKKFSKQRNYQALLRFRRQAMLTAVDGVDLKIKKGELFGLLGPNGAGKTTLVKMLSTLILPTTGRALVGGYDVVADAAKIRGMIGLVDNQERSFFWRLSGQQNLEFFASLYNLRGLEAKKRIADLLTMVGLQDHANRRVTDYSSGMRQKLAIVRGVLLLPQVVFMDEPTRSLDPVSARDLRGLVRGLLVDQLGCTVVLVTHRLEEAEALCDRVAIMKQGQIIACDSVAKIKQHFAGRQRYYFQVHNLPHEALETLKTIPGVIEVAWQNSDSQSLNLDVLMNDEKETLPPIIRFLVSQNAAVQRCQAQTLSLEEAFVHMLRDAKDEA